MHPIFDSTYTTSLLGDDQVLDETHTRQVLVALTGSALGSFFVSFATYIEDPGWCRLEMIYIALGMSAADALGEFPG